MPTILKNLLDSPAPEVNPAQQPKVKDARTLRSGMRGEDVRALQMQLNAERRSLGLPLIKVDGIFGAETRGAVKDHQEATGIRQDGVVGEDTRASLAPTPKSKPDMSLEKTLAKIRPGQDTAELMMSVNRLDLLGKSQPKYPSDKEQAQETAASTSMPMYRGEDEAASAAMPLPADMYPSGKGQEIGMSADMPYTFNNTQATNELAMSAGRAGIEDFGRRKLALANAKMGLLNAAVDRQRRATILEMLTKQGFTPELATATAAAEASPMRPSIIAAREAGAKTGRALRGFVDSGKQLGSAVTKPLTDPLTLLGRFARDIVTGDMPTVGPPLPLSKR